MKEFMNNITALPLIILSIIVVGVMVLVIMYLITYIRFKKKEYFIKQEYSLYYLYKLDSVGCTIRIEDMKAVPNSPEYYDFIGINYAYRDLYKAKQSLLFHKHGSVIYRDYEIKHILKDDEIAFRFNRKGFFEYDFYKVFSTIEECKLAIDELIERKNKEKEEYIKNHKIILL